MPPGGAAIFGLDDHQLATDRITVGEPVIRVPEVRQSKKASESALRNCSIHVRPGTASRIPVLYSRGPNGGLLPDAELLAAYFQPAGKLLSGGGGLLSTPADYLRFAQMLLNGGELDGKRILTRESVAAMRRNHLPSSLTPIVSPMVGHDGTGMGSAEPCSSTPQSPRFRGRRVSTGGGDSWAHSFGSIQRRT